METTSAARRGRGRPPRVSRTTIIDAAKDISPDLLSMQSVADRLGVDRSTINYHFADREELFSVVASAIFGAEMALYSPPASDDWRDWVKSYAHAVHAALLQHPELAGYVRLSFGGDATAFEPVEGLIRRLSEAGFDERNVAQTIAFISEVVHAAVRNEILVNSGGHPQGAEIEGFLEQQPAQSVPGLRLLIEMDPYSYAGHFEFAVTMLVAGLDSLPHN